MSNFYLRYKNNYAQSQTYNVLVKKKLNMPLGMDILTIQRIQIPLFTLHFPQPLRLDVSKTKTHKRRPKT